MKPTFVGSIVSYFLKLQKKQKKLVASAAGGPNYKHFSGCPVPCARVHFLSTSHLENVIFYDNFVRVVRQIIFFESHFIEFYQKQEEKVKNKIQYVFELIKQVQIVPEKFLKHVEGTEGLFEVRVEYQSNIYRIFCCFDDGRLIVLFNGFQKKTQMTPKKEIEKAKKLMKKYIQSKK